MITATVELLKRNILRKDRDGTGNSVVTNCDYFQGCNNDVCCVETTRSSQTSTAARQKLYGKGGIVPMYIGRLYKFYLPLDCNQLL